MMDLDRKCTSYRCRPVALLVCSLVFAGATAIGCDSEEPKNDEGASGTSKDKEKPDKQRKATSASAPESTGAGSSADVEPVDGDAIAEIIGVDGKTTDQGVVRVTWSRSEVSVNIDGVQFPPSAGLTSWAGFAPTQKGAMLMGDTVVFQDEVSPAIDAAFAHGLEITALHNHFFYDEPKVYFMHIGGHGDPEELARGVRAVWDAIREVRSAHPEPQKAFGGEVPASEGELDPEEIANIVGKEPARKKAGVLKVAFPRKGTAHGIQFGGSMGLASWAAFTGSSERATIDGDFAMTAAEVQPVLHALRDANIHVVALHNHMLAEQPAYYFTHFWGKGPAADLAQGFRAAVDAMRESSR